MKIDQERRQNETTMAAQVLEDDREASNEEEAIQTEKIVGQDEFVGTKSENKSEMDDGAVSEEIRLAKE